MITLEELQTLSIDRLDDAKALYKACRYDGAFYICGYVLELRLKKKICETLGWAGYPSTKKEFENLGGFKTHNLEILLHLSGIEGKIRDEFFIEWSVANRWDSEIRYSLQKKQAQVVESMLKATEILLQNI